MRLTTLAAAATLVIGFAAQAAVAPPVTHTAPPHHRHVPKGADAICRDGTYSFAGHHKAIGCAQHGGVQQWW
jgi:hypothetical protein